MRTHFGFTTLILHCMGRTTTDLIGRDSLTNYYQLRTLNFILSYLLAPILSVFLKRVASHCQLDAL